MKLCELFFFITVGALVCTFMWGMQSILMGEDSVVQVFVVFCIFTVFSVFIFLLSRKDKS